MSRFKVPFENPLDFGFGQRFVQPDDRLKFSEHFEAGFDFGLFAADAKLFAANDDVDAESRAEHLEVLITAPEKNPNVFLTIE